MIVSRLTRRALIGIIFAALVCVSNPIFGQSPDGIKYSLDDAVKMVRERTGGEVVRAETREKSGHVIHRIRIMTKDGRVRTFDIDAQTGKPR